MNSYSVVLEPNMNGLPHTEINIGLCEVIEQTFNDDFIFYLDDNHRKAIELKHSFNSRWKFASIKVFDHNPFNFVFNDLILIYRLAKLLLLHNKANYFILLGIMPLTQIFISFLNQVLRRKIIICLHGQMEAYLPLTKIGYSKYYYLISKFIFKRNDNLRYVVFSDTIFNAIRFLFKGTTNKAIIIDQPYVFDNNGQSLSKVVNDKPLRLAVIGRGDKAKNIDSLFLLVKKLEPLIKDGFLTFSVIGKMYTKIPEDCHNLIEYNYNGYNNDEFNKRIIKIDFSLIFADKDDYRAIPSGSFFDSLKWDKPVISLNNDFVNGYFRKYNNLGYICNNEEEMINVIKYITQNDFTIEYKQFINNISLAKDKMSIENISKNFQYQL